MTDFATMIDFATSDFKAAQPAAEFVAKKFSATLQAYPSLAEYYEWTVSSATDAYANRPSVDAMFDLTRTTITQKAPWMVSQVIFARFIFERLCSSWTSADKPTYLDR